LIEIREKENSVTWWGIFWYPNDEVHSQLGWAGSWAEQKESDEDA
jgi:hypothetical protein